MKLSKLKCLQNKKGSAQDIFMFIVVGFSFALICTLGFYLVSQINPTLKDKIGGTQANISINETLDIWEASTGSLDFASVGVIMGLMLAVILSALLVRLHPAFYFLFFILLILAIVVAVPLSNSYELFEDKLGTSGDMSITSFIMTNLPLFVAVIGVAALIISFVKMGSGGGGGL